MRTKTLEQINKQACRIFDAMRGKGRPSKAKQARTKRVIEARRLYADNIYVYSMQPQYMSVDLDNLKVPVNIYTKPRNSWNIS